MCLAGPVCSTQVDNPSRPHDARHMSPQRWQEIHELFDELVDLEADAQRTRLEEIGAEDPDLRTEVESLLEAYGKADEILPSLDGVGMQEARTHPRLSEREQIGHYEILGEIGRGGMGTVYRARDTRLHRPIALKFLRPDVGDDDRVRERFMREARAASALDHPNIAVVYDIGETDEEGTYIAMRYYEGQTVRDRIKEGPVSIDESIDIALQVARGLEAAHQADIIHRDIKPGNIIVTPSGIAKVLDFGLAKFTAGSDLTRTGSSLGTPAYMSPEQIRSDDVDHRTDQWGLGVILYEMLTGERCFTGEYEQALLYSILNENPPPVSEQRPEVPDRLAEVVDRLLQKDAAKRYSDTGDLVKDLTALKEGTARKERLPDGSESPTSISDSAVPEAQSSSSSGSRSSSSTTGFELNRSTQLDYSEIWNKTLAMEEELIYEFSVSHRYITRVSATLGIIVVLGVLGGGVSEIFSTSSSIFLLGIGYFWFYLPRARAYALTDRRFVEHRGWLSPEVTSIPYARITQIRVKEPFFQSRLFKTGKLMIYVREAPNAAVELNHIDAPHMVKNRIEELATGEG